MKAQYAKSTDPAVVAIVQQNEAARREAWERIVAWVEAHGAQTWISGGPPGGIGCSAIILDRKPEGWANGYRGRGYRPRKGTAEWAEMEALTWSPEKVPGLPRVFESGSHTRDGSMLWMWPTPFHHDGAAWLLLSQFPDLDGDFGPEWQEVPASEAHGAYAAYKAEAAS